MNKYIITHKVTYKVAAENEKKAKEIFYNGEIIDYDVDCYAVEIDFGESK